jgi:replicative DNA helicase
MAFTERVPPQSTEAEQSVLGAALIDNSILPEIRRHLTADDWYSEKHRIIWEAICKVHDRKDPVDMVTVQDELTRVGRLNDVDGMPYLATLMNLVPTTANAPEYARIVADKAQLRRMQAAARKVADLCYSAESPDEIRPKLVEIITRSAYEGQNHADRLLGPKLLAYMERTINERQENKPPASLIQTGFKFQDALMPMVRGETTAVGARSGGGKTTYEKQLQINVARLSGPVLSYSLEMSEEQLLQKYWGNIGDVDTMRIRLGKMTDEEISRSMAAVAGIQDLPIYFLARPRMRWADIRVDAQAFAARHGRPALITVDYWQILSDKPPRDGRRDSLLGELVLDAKDLAIELDCHIVFLVQVRINKSKPVPENEDVLESRDIVRSADNVLYLVRPTECDPDAEITLAYQHPQTKQIIEVECKCGDVNPWKPTEKLFDGVLLGYQGKQRMGRLEVIPYHFDPPTGRITDLLPPWPWQAKAKT